MSRFQVHFDLPDLLSVQQMAARIALHLKRGDVLQLKGDLGVGKTTFTRALIHALAGHALEVPSPTFTIVQQYDLPQFMLCHFDLYRLKHSNELIEVGLEQALSEGVAVLEWPELAAEFLPQDSSLVLEFFWIGQGRAVQIYAPASWEHLSL